eukprot:s4426_g2.t1
MSGAAVPPPFCLQQVSNDLGGIPTGLTVSAFPHRPVPSSPCDVIKTQGDQGTKQSLVNYRAAWREDSMHDGPVRAERRRLGRRKEPERDIALQPVPEKVAFPSRRDGSAAVACPAFCKGRRLDTRGSTEESRTYFRSSAQLSDYDAHIRATAAELGVAVEHLQTNDLDECIRLLSGTDAHAIAAISDREHASRGFGKEPALVECIAALRKPVFEVHYGNFFAKGATSLVTAACNGLICGAKLSSYSAGMRAAVEALTPSPFDHPPAEETAFEIEERDGADQPLLPYSLPEGWDDEGSGLYLARGPLSFVEAPAHGSVGVRAAGAPNREKILQDMVQKLEAKPLQLPIESSWTNFLMNLVDLGPVPPEFGEDTEMGSFMDLKLHLHWHAKPKIVVTCKLGTVELPSMQLGCTFYFGFHNKVPEPPFFDAVCMYMGNAAVLLQKTGVNLWVRGMASILTGSRSNDPYVTVDLGGTAERTLRTPTCYNTLEPAWKEQGNHMSGRLPCKGVASEGDEMARKLGVRVLDLFGVQSLDYFEREREAERTCELEQGWPGKEHPDPENGGTAKLELGLQWRPISHSVSAQLPPDVFLDDEEGSEEEEEEVRWPLFVLRVGVQHLEMRRWACSGEWGVQATFEQSFRFFIRNAKPTKVHIAFYSSTDLKPEEELRIGGLRFPELQNIAGPRASRGGEVVGTSARVPLLVVAGHDLCAGCLGVVVGEENSLQAAEAVVTVRVEQAKSRWKLLGDVQLNSVLLQQDLIMEFKDEELTNWTGAACPRFSGQLQLWHINNMTPKKESRQD